MQLSRGRGETSRRRGTSNLFRRQSAAKQLGFDPEGTALPSPRWRAKYSPHLFFLVRSFRSKAARAAARTMAPVCQEASGSRQPFVKGITSSLVPSPPRNIKIPTYLRRAWWRRAPQHSPSPFTLLACFACTLLFLRSSRSAPSFHPRRSRGPVHGTQ